MIGAYNFTYISLKLIGYVQMKHPQVSRTVLVDCVNDKYTYYRRKKRLE